MPLVVHLSYQSERSPLPTQNMKPGSSSLIAFTIETELQDDPRNSLL